VRERIIEHEQIVAIAAIDLNYRPSKARRYIALLKDTGDLIRRSRQSCSLCLRRNTGCDRGVKVRAARGTDGAVVPLIFGAVSAPARQNTAVQQADQSRAPARKPI